MAANKSAPAEAARGAQNEIGRLDEHYTPTAILIDQLGSHNAGDRRFAAAELALRYPPEADPPPDPQAVLDAICRRLAMDDRGRQAFALSALVNGTPVLGERVVELVGALIDERDDLELRLLDHTAHALQRTEATWTE